MKKRYIVLPILACTFFSYASDLLIQIMKTQPSAEINNIIYTRHTFYNTPRQGVDNKAWDAFVNPKECAQWDEYDYWCALHYVSQQQNNIFDEEYKSYYAGGYIFYVLDSVLINLIHQWKLYEYTGFWKFLSSLPDYADYIVSSYELIQKDKNAYNALTSSSYKKIHAEYQKIKDQEKEKEKISKINQDIKDTAQQDTSTSE